MAFEYALLYLNTECVMKIILNCLVYILKNHHAIRWKSK